MSAWDPMTPDELKKAMTRLSIDKSNYERIFLSHERTIRRWLAGSCPVPGPVAAYMRTLCRDRSEEVIYNGFPDATRALNKKEL